MPVLECHTDPLINQLLQSVEGIDGEKVQQIVDDEAQYPDPRAALINSGLVDDRQIAAAYSGHYLLPLFDPPDESFDSVDQSVADLLPANFCARHRIVPLADDGSTLQVAIDCPESLLLADDIRFHTGRQMAALFTTPAVITAGIVKLFDLAGYADSGPVEFTELTKASRKPEPKSACGEKPDCPMDWLLARVVQLRADSVQVQRSESSSRLRFRIDGQLMEVSPPHSMDALIDQIDGVTDWNSNQPSSINHSTSCGSMQIRVHRCEIAGGQSWTLNFIRGPVRPPSLSELSLLDDERIDLIRGIQKPRGLTIIAGPCDSGKNETLYSALAAINNPSLSIFTVEQNVRYTLPGVNQTIVNDTDPFGLHDHLQSVLCQSPDVLLVHQIRDAATADLCVRVAEGGRRVLLTLPSADCNAALRHLESLGVSATRIGQTVRAVVSQRRMRRLCDHCKRPQTVSAEARRRIGIRDTTTVYEAGGCGRCMGSGYHGRITAYEVMRLNSRMSQKLTRYGSMQDLEDADLQGCSLRSRMMSVVTEGETSLDELRRTL